MSYMTFVQDEYEKNSFERGWILKNLILTYSFLKIFLWYLGIFLIIFRLIVLCSTFWVNF
jgi:hypothetical protein